MQRFKFAENRIFSVDGHPFLFLTEENAIFEMAAELEAFVKGATPLRPQPLSQLMDRLEGTEAEKRELVNALLKGRVLVPEAAAPAPMAFPDPAAIDLPLQTLVLHVTEACNLGCLYCYHGGSGQGVGPTRSMRLPVAHEAVDFLFAHSADLPEVVLVFFGGEPFLNFGLIRDVVGYAREKAAAKGQRVQFAATTNGTLLTPEIIDFIHANQVGVTVSLDGFEQIQDRYRPFPDGSPSYRAILPGVRRLLAHPLAKPAVARVTVCREPSAVPQILDHLLSLGFAEAGFAPVTSENPEYQLDADGMHALLEIFKLLAQRFLEFARREEFFGFTNLVDMLVTLHEGEVKNYPCGAGLGLFAVAPDGRLFLCQRLTGEASLAMGDIHRGFDRPRIAAFRKKARLSQKTVCSTCWARKICAGGCYHEALVREGSVQQPNLHYCEWIKRWIETGIQVYGRLASSQPEYLDKLSLLRGHGAPVQPML
jgi:uncharacterized protein